MPDRYLGAVPEVMQNAERMDSVLSALAERAAT